MMKKNLLYLIAIPLIFSACKSKCVEDLGIHTNREFTVKPFDEIKLSGPMRIQLRQDSSFKISILADSNAIGLIKPEVSGHQLRLKLDNNEYCGKDSIIVSVGIGALKKIDAGGAGHIYTSSAINAGDLELNLSGATMLMMEMNVANLTTTTDGTANLILLGQAGSHRLKSKGALQLNAFSFVAGVYNLDVEGVAKLKINVLNDLKIRASGAADISYKGSPKNIDEKKNGTYKLEKVN